MLRLTNSKVAIFVGPMYEDLEFWYPYLRLKEAGAEVTCIGPEVTAYKSKHGLPVMPDIDADSTRAIEYDALVIPGGYAPDHMRRSPSMVKFVREMNKQNKPVAAICHGPWMLASADILKGRTATSFHSIKDDVTNAGAEWVDLKVVKSENLITSRMPDDLPAFCTALIEVMENSAETSTAPADAS